MWRTEHCQREAAQNVSQCQAGEEQDEEVVATDEHWGLSLCAVRYNIPASE